MKESGSNHERAKATEDFRMMFDTTKQMLENSGERGGSFLNELGSALAKQYLPYHDAVRHFRHTALSREVVLGEGLEPLQVTLRSREKPHKTKAVTVELEGFSEVLELNKEGAVLFQVDEESGDLVDLGEADPSYANYYKRILNAFPDD